MATLIAIYNASGCVGRCDANCFTAENEECQCICAGKNHGVGWELAFSQTTDRDEARLWIERYVKKHKITKREAEIIGASDKQEMLF